MTKKGSLSDLLPLFLTAVQHESGSPGAAAVTYCFCPPEEIRGKCFSMLYRQLVLVLSP